MSALDKAKQIKKERDEEYRKAAEESRKFRESMDKEATRKRKVAKKIFKEFHGVKDWVFSEDKDSGALILERNEYTNTVRCKIEWHTCTFRYSDDSDYETHASMEYYLTDDNGQTSVISSDEGLEEAVARIMAKYI